MFKGAWGRCPQQASGEENHKGIFFSAGLCVLTQALLASIIPNQNNFGITTVLAIPHDGGSGRHRGTESRGPYTLGGADEHAESTGGGNDLSRVYLYLELFLFVRKPFDTAIIRAYT